MLDSKKVSLSVPQEIIRKAYEEIEKCNCLRRRVVFELESNGEYSCRFDCYAFGNGYGMATECKEACKLRISDIKRCDTITGTKEDGTKGLFVIQDDFYISEEEECG